MDDSSDLVIVGIEASSKDDAYEVMDSVDALVDQGTISVREASIAYKTKHGRVKIAHVSDHGAGIGALVGAGWGAATLGVGLAAGTIAVAGAPILAVAFGVAMGLGVDVGIGAAIGKAFDLHHEAGGKILKAMSDHVAAGNAVVYLIVDPANAAAITDSLAGRSVYWAMISGEEQARIAATLEESA